MELEDIVHARTSIASSIRETPCRISDELSLHTSSNVFLKLENHQKTGSFKCRGALHRLQKMDPAQRKRGVVAASAGNHAQGVAYFAATLGIPSIIVMPEATPLNKVSRTSEHGAEVVLHGADFDSAYSHALDLTSQLDRTFIHPFNDPYVIAGQGTIGLEILEQCTNADCIIVPVGGGGLISGIAIAAKALKPTIRIVGVEPQALPSMKAAIAAGGPVTLPTAQTLAEGITVRSVGELTYRYCRELVDDWVQVDDNEIAAAVLFLLEQEKTLAEGAGAAGVAALLAGKVKSLGKNTVALVCGGNLDVNVLARIIERGLVESGRRIKIEIGMVDYPGALAKLLSDLASFRVNVLEIHHERTFQSGTVRDVRVSLTLETRGPEHVQKLFDRLRAQEYEINPSYEGKE